MKTEKNKELKINIEIHDDRGMTIINEPNFDRAIIDLINEREWYNYSLKEEMIKKIEGEKQNNKKKFVREFSYWSKRKRSKPRKVSFWATKKVELKK